MELKKLHPNVINQTRSSFLINNVCQVVMELVLNSLDAKSTSIAVRLNLITLRIQVVDNGEGISKENMELIGLRYFTNRYNALQDHGNNFYGLRGETLANLIELSTGVHITSKPINSSTTYNKILTKNNYTGIINATKDRPSVGTTVTVEGLFQNYPVRKNRIIKELELDEIVKNIKGLIIMHHDINFSVRDDVEGELLLSSSKTDDIISAFRHLHPEIKEEGTLMKISKGKITINSMLFKNFSENKKIQYVFVNKRPVSSTKINKCLHKVFLQNCKQKRNEQCFPVYVLNIKCPYTEFDISYHATKTTVEFKHHEKLEYYIKKLINTFFGNSNHSSKPLELLPVTETRKYKCGMSQIQGLVRAFGYKRKHEESNKDLCADNSKKSLQQNEITQDKEEFDIIDPTPFTPKNNFKFKQPLPITIVPKEIIPPSNQNTLNYDESLSQFTNDENKGKHLIMNMFLKSTHVYNGDEDVQNLSQDSQETVYEEESNFQLENNFETVLNGEKKAMSMSINVKSTTKIRKPVREKRSQGFQTSYGKNMVSKGLQTTLNKELNSLDNVDNYTLVFSNFESSPSFKFLHQKSDKCNGNPNFVFGQICQCNCHDRIKFDFSDLNSSKRDALQNDEMEIRSNYFCKVNNKSKDNYKHKSFEVSPYFISNNKYHHETLVNRLQSNYHNQHYVIENSVEQKITKSKQKKILPDHEENRFCSTTIHSFDNFKPMCNSTEKNFQVENVKQVEETSPVTENLDEVLITKTCNENEVISNENLDENNSELVITLSDKDKLNLLEKELGFEKSIWMKEFLAWNSQFTQTENKTLENDYGDWVKQTCLGKKCFVNKKTGYVTYSSPIRNEKLFVLSERNEFVPKGMSPILKEIKPVDKPLSENGKETLLEYIMEIYKSELLYVKWQHYLDDMDSKTFFENIYKVKLTLFENCVPNIVDRKKIQIDGIHFTRDLFTDIQIIGQLDRKFIIAKDEKKHLLVVFDQHAVHERIRLEHLSKIYKNAKALCKESVILFLTKNDISLLKRCETYVNYVGISLEYLSNCIRVIEVPLCVYVKFQQQESTESFNNLVKIMINEVIELLKSTRAASLKVLPRVVQNVVNLEACRGAIKFGDFLNKQQCTELLQKLSTTELPFQCAHGRPTVIPLLSLESNMVKNKLTKFNTLKNHKNRQQENYH